MEYVQSQVTFNIYFLKESMGAVGFSNKTKLQSFEGHARYLVDFYIMSFFKYCW